jgi:hypothetical protein
MTTASSSRTSRTLPFIFLCLYVSSQAFTVPILVLGPSWAVWPTLADITGAMLFCAVVVTHLKHGTAIPDRGHSLVRFACLLFVMCGLSYILLMVLDTSLHPHLTGKGKPTGLFQLYRVFQTITIFWATLTIPLDKDRLRILGSLVLMALAFVGLSVLLDYYDIVPSRAYAAHLPQDISRAGYWAFYKMGAAGKGVGCLSYNHAATAAQILALAALSIHLRGSQLTKVGVIMLLFAVLCIAFTESRMGFVCMVLFVCGVIRSRPIYSAAAGITAVTIIAIILTSAGSSPIETVIDRQATIGSSYSEDGLSGRDFRWRERFDYLNEKPVRWIAGSGFGSSVEGGDWAHMQFLTLLVEGGIIALVIFCAGVVYLLRLLKRSERGIRAITCLTLVLLFSCFTQETLYPVPVFANLLCFYMCIVGMVFTSDRTAAVPTRSRFGA